MTKHEKTIQQHIKNNVSMAIDQADSYGGLREAFEAFLQNTVDSCLEDNYDDFDSFEAGREFVNVFNKTSKTNF